MSQVARPSFGLLTVINPTLRQRVEKELREYADRGYPNCRSSHQAPTLEALRLWSGDQKIATDKFVPRDTSDPGIFPDIGLNAQAGLLPLPKGWGLIATNDQAVVADSRPWKTIYPHDDLNHALAAARGQGHEPITLSLIPLRLTAPFMVSGYLAHEQKRSAAGAKPPIHQFEQTA
ncbi:MAG: hypothetical protein KC474_04765 [Cyanobacteria bacterium HKST-UBA04]|nr:hypothetical protein [Cyanobacteria bacterium HKST-UBA04]